MNFFGKCAVVLAVMLALPMTLTAQIKVTHGPWLTDMSDTGVTIMWKTDKPAMAWVEYDEKTGDTFYSEHHVGGDVEVRHHQAFFLRQTRSVCSMPRPSWTRSISKPAASTNTSNSS